MTNPDGYTALDLVGYTDQGDYDATKSYVANDLVHYGGSIWRCLIDDTVGITPTEGVNWRFWVENSQNGISDIVNILGAKNLLPYPYVDGTSKTHQGITFTVGEKGKITVSGTSTGTAQFFLARNLQFDNPTILSLKSDGAGTNITLVAFNGSTFYTANTSKGKALPIGTYNIYLLIQNGNTADDIVYPMIRPSGIEDATYVPYTKTNKELTAEVTQNSSDIQTLTNQVSTNTSNISANATAIAKCETLVVSVPSFSALPQTITNANIEDDMVVVNSVLSNPSAQLGDWTVTTSNGSLTISGSIGSTTTATLYLMKSR